MMHKMISVETKEKFVISATFLDGTVKEYDVRRMFDVYPKMKALENEELFCAIQLDVGGFGVSWNDELDLESETIWEEGAEVKHIPVDLFFELAAVLVKARNEVGMTQKQLAERTGIHQAEISKIERGLANPSVKTIKRLANGMDLDLHLTFTPKKEK